MKITKKTAEYTVFKRADGRYAVKGSDKNFINGEDKVKILLSEGLLELHKAKAPAEESSQEQTEAVDEA